MLILRFKVKEGREGGRERGREGGEYYDQSDREPYKIRLVYSLTSRQHEQSDDMEIICL